MTEIVWAASTTFFGGETSIDVWFDGDRMSDHVLAAIVRVTADLGGHHLRAHMAMLEDWTAADSTVRDYHDHHVDDLGEPPTPAPEDFLATLKLARIGIYPDPTAERAVVFDYTTGRDRTDNLLVVEFATDGRVTGLAMES